MAQTQIILLERVEDLGQMGDVVAVKPGYARNYLLPKAKALRASKANLAYFEGQKKQLEAANLAKKAEAEKIAGKLKDLTVVILRQAAEGGQLYGSVSARDIAEASAAQGLTIDRSQVRVNQAFKTLGLFTVDIMLHPEVKVKATVNIARSEEEAKAQKKLGRAIVADAEGKMSLEDTAAADKAAFLEQAALSAEAAQAAQAEQEAAQTAAERAEKSAKRAAKKANKKADEPGEVEGEEAAE
jgi:large subunit ribosomal protein L9